MNDKKLFSQHMKNHYQHFTRGGIWWNQIKSHFQNGTLQAFDNLPHQDKAQLLETMVKHYLPDHEFISTQKDVIPFWESYLHLMYDEIPRNSTHYNTLKLRFNKKGVIKMLNKADNNDRHLLLDNIAHHYLPDYEIEIILPH